MVNITIFGGLPRDECGLVNRLLKNKVSYILKYEFQKNGFVL